jgi:hypothetical protein
VIAFLCEKSFKREQNTRLVRLQSNHKVAVPTGDTSKVAREASAMHCFTAPVESFVIFHQLG